MISLESARHERYRLTPMTVYQFAFYTFYQVFRKRAKDGESTWKAGIVIGVLQIWIAAAILFSVSLLRHVPYWPPTWVSIVFVLVDTFLVYYAFDRHDRWEQYAHQFSHYSEHQLRVGRILVGAVFVLIAVCFFSTLWRATATLPLSR